ncbi:histidine kinase [Allokutzneria sp. A3M-2-11 16]|uniref:sensor histidine kinase n=1 Tax=Allokutzneria sp. A3M-2-11 16 TaxID=2962043 RepID=UPI0020B6884B|nr:histidine kinase [Allokutzneria sp. A3M-2-11 16]MCP3800751.1 histidine kinase [Allokutzneria sp. A3M-2-11 16]
MTLGVLFGLPMALVDLGFLLWAGLVSSPGLVWPVLRRSSRPMVLVQACALVRMERRRLVRWCGAEPGRDNDGRRALRYLAARAPIGLLGGLVVFVGFWYGVSFLAVYLYVPPGSLLEGTRGWAIQADPTDSHNEFYMVALTVLGLIGLYVTALFTFAQAAVERWLLRSLLGPSAVEVLERRVTQLSVSRAEMVTAINDERRRIERDLHDGIQQRLVALGMLLGRARRGTDPDMAQELLRQAHEESQQALTDLREVAWRVYPSALDDLGLAEVLAALVERSEVPVRLHYRLEERLASPVEAVVYFVVFEAVTNAVKHSGASCVEVHIGRIGDEIVVIVGDDGRGGADPAGHGLSGLAGRVAALDGEFVLSSPAGGPTEIRVMLPCG